MKEIRLLMILSISLVLIDGQTITATTTPKQGEDDHDLEKRLLNDPNVFPRPDLISARFGVVLKPIVVEDKLALPSFQAFLSYYQKKLQDEFDSASEEKVKTYIRDALERTFDLLLKQYGRFKATDDIEALIGGARRKKRNDEDRGGKDFYFSRPFIQKLLRETGKVLDETIRVHRANRLINPSHQPPPGLEG